MIISTKLCKISFPSHTMNVTSNEWKLCWWEWMYWKTRIFTMFMMFPKPVSLRNVYISHGHNFSIGSNIGIMYLNVNPHKTVHSKTLEKWPFVFNYLWRFSKLRHWLWYWPLCKGICPSEFCKRMNAFSEKPEHYEVLSMSKTLFQVELSVWMLLLWLIHMQFIIQNQYIHMNRENKQQK